uniref:volume-regulated anion channel subunit LRRC8A-like isoform X2 n=1 Tax=Myxine glutinosa TaxID=7769 RepID=UPI00358FC251
MHLCQCRRSRCTLTSSDAGCDRAPVLLRVSTSISSAQALVGCVYGATRPRPTFHRRLFRHPSGAFHQTLFCPSNAPRTHSLLPVPTWMLFYITLSIICHLFARLLSSVTQDKMICLPCLHACNCSCLASPPPCPAISRMTNHSPGHNLSALCPKPSPGLQTSLDRHQYFYVDSVCYERQLHWFPKYFPYLVLLHTLLFMLCSTFWFRYPKTCSKIEHFVTVLAKCFDSPWTNRALSETVEGGTGAGSGPQGSKGVSDTLRPTPNLERTPRRTNPQPSSLYDDPESQTPMLGPGGSGGTTDHGTVAECGVSFVNTGNLSSGRTTGGRGEVGSLDRKETEQAKALFEKVAEFLAIEAYSLRCLSKITFDVPCSLPSIEKLTGYSLFCCAHPLSTLLTILASSYLILVGIYGAVCVYALVWMLRSQLRQYSFTREHGGACSDVPDVKNDFAFVLHLVDQYDPLYAQRFAIFLSEVSENKLRQLNLNQEWTRERLLQKLTRNAQDKLELHLFMLSGLPDAVLELHELEVLKLELVPDVVIPARVSQLSSLQGLWLYHSPTRLDSPALSFLRENLLSLHLKFTEPQELPLWLSSLKNLQELHLTGSLGDDPRMPALDALRELKHLSCLRIKSSLGKIPQVVSDLGPQLQTLCLNNEGSKLLVLSSLKRLSGLTELQLVRCDLQRIPHAIFSLSSLQSLDLKDNNLQTVEELISFQHLHRLTSLKLWYNNISYLPVQIGMLSALEQLILTRNQLCSVPNQLFLCRRLRLLDLSHNLLTHLPQDIVKLSSLQHLALSGNKLEALPEELFSCQRLRVLNLGHNALPYLSPRVGQLQCLSQLELRGNPLGALPATLSNCPCLRRANLVVEPALYCSLPATIQEQLERHT